MQFDYITEHNIITMSDIANSNIALHRDQYSDWELNSNL